MDIQVKVKKLKDPTAYKRQWDTQFVNDLIRHEGKTVTLTNYVIDEEDNDISYHLETNGDIDWHNGGYWTSNGSINEFKMLFHRDTDDVLPKELVEL